MSGPASAPATFYRLAEVAAMLRCSEWWVKEQARRRRIPYSWIGGSYLFTEEHIAAIVRLFEIQPGRPEPAVGTARTIRPPETAAGDGVTRLRARPPRGGRSRSTIKHSA